MGQSPEIRYDLNFSSKGLHFCNLNIGHLLPNIDELRTVMASDKCPDILGIRETFWTKRTKFPATIKRL